jgi:hypothetical protein
MTISIHIGAIYDIETYDGLIEYIRNALELDDDTYAQLPTLIRIAEYRLNRLVIAPEREVRTTIETVAGQQYIDLPSGFRQARAVFLNGDTGYPLAGVTPQVLLGNWADSSGAPQAYAIQNMQLWLGPAPDAVYEIDLTYIEKLPGLSTSNQSNWLLRGNADAYVYSVIFQVAVYLEDKALAIGAETELFRIIEEVNAQGNRFRKSTPVRLRSPVVV